MTEAEWQTADDWRPMLEFLNWNFSKRKKGLYLCGGLRSIWHLLYDENSRRAVEVAEQDADGKVTDEDCRYAAWCAECPTFGFHFNSSSLLEITKGRAENGDPPDPSWGTSGYGTGVDRLLEMGVYKAEDIGTVEDLGDPVISRTLLNAAWIAYYPLFTGLCREGQHERMMGYLARLQEWPGAWLVREVFGNPFRPFVVDPAWLTWDGGTVPGIAQGIYEESAFDRLPILADALEDAGCEDRVVVGHCRFGERHVKGCWVVDAVLGLK